MSTRRPITDTARARPEPQGAEAESQVADLAAAVGAGENFHAELHEAVDARRPLELLSLASNLLSALDPRGHAIPSNTDGENDGEPDRSRPPGSPGEGHEDITVSTFADALLSASTRQTDALASVIGAMSGDDELRERIRREVRSRRLPIPGWVRRIDQIEPSRATAMTHPLDDGQSIAVEVRPPDDRVCVVLVYVDHNLGTAVTNVFVMDDNLDHVVGHWHPPGSSGEGEDPDLPLAHARARLTEAIETGTTTIPPLRSETWPLWRPFVEWVISMMPPGGTGYERPQWTAEDLADLTDRFARSPHAAELSEDDVELADLFIDFGINHGSGDPLRWSPTAVELLLEWLPSSVRAAPASLAAAPRVLRAFVSFSHAERGVARDVTAETLASIEAHAPRSGETTGDDEVDPSGRSAERTRRMQEIALRRRIPRRGFPHAAPGGALRRKYSAGRPGGTASRGSRGRGVSWR